ncbi:MAG TPA: hypothetical protein VJ692_14340 [Nitrospiraceae bacterium]|nr:hypothetical protein [Nitrospiraceae bacterium]
MADDEKAISGRCLPVFRGINFLIRPIYADAQYLNQHPPAMWNIFY